MFQNRAQLLTKRCAGPASSPGRCTCGLALPLLVTFPCTGLEGSRRGAGGDALLPPILPAPTSHPEISRFREAGGEELKLISFGLSRVCRKSWKGKPASSSCGDVVDFQAYCEFWGLGSWLLFTDLR